jgi:hypothetical protein
VVLTETPKVCLTHAGPPGENYRVASHFSAIGFGVSREKFSELLDAALANGTRIPVKEQTAYYVLKAGGGPELWVAVREANGSKDLLAVTPYFRGRTRFDARLEGLHANDEFPFEGRADLWAVGRGGEDEPHPLSVDLADFSLGSGHATGEILSLPISGFAHAFDWWRDETTYASAGTGLAPRAFIPLGMFKDPGEPLSSALFTGVIEAADRVTNTATGQEFVHVQVDTLCGRIDVVADSGLVRETPTKGGIVKTTCWLCSTIT